jgi:hypothetical protein
MVRYSWRMIHSFSSALLVFSGNCVLAATIVRMRSSEVNCLAALK